MYIKKVPFKVTIIILISLVFIFPASADISFLPASYDTLGAPPSSFDLRSYNNVNYVTSIKDQSGGTCWTHGAMAAIESNLLMTGNWEAAGETVEPNLAEYHLDWWNGFNQHNNDDVYPPTGNGLEVHMGGDYRVTSAYLGRGEGAIYSPDANDDTEYDANWYMEPPERDASSYQYYYVPDIEWYVLGPDLEHIDSIKEALMDHGALGTSFCVSSSYMENYSHYQPPDSTRDPNHAVAIIGWDDSKETPAPEPGAWLCKNSWGSGWGEEGYFWISYYDKHCGQHPEMGIISFQNVEFLQYTGFYYHDYHGWRDTLMECEEAFNVFFAQSDELLTAVSFYTPIDGAFYHVKIFDGFENGELVDELSSTQGTIDHMGFHTITLDNPVKLSKGDDFYIYLNLPKGGHPYDRTSEVPVLLGSSHSGVIVNSIASSGESYYLNNGEWSDLYQNYDIPYPRTANFCMKGLTIPQEIQIDVSGGLGITAEIQNNMGSELTAVEWTLNFDGGLVLLQQNTEGVIPSIPDGGSATIQTGFVIGFGPSRLTLTVDTHSKDYNVLLLGPFSFIR